MSDTEVLGIAPGPQKIETILSAYEEVLLYGYEARRGSPEYKKRVRQGRAFRARILKMYYDLVEEHKSVLGIPTWDEVMDED